MSRHVKDAIAKEIPSFIYPFINVFSNFPKRSLCISKRDFEKISLPVIPYANH